MLFNFRDNILTLANVTVKPENDDFEVPSRHEVLRFVRIDGKVSEEVLLPKIKVKRLTVLNSIGIVDETNRVPVSSLNTGESPVVCRFNEVKVHKIQEDINEMK